VLFGQLPARQEKKKRARDEERAKNLEPQARKTKKGKRTYN